MKNESSTVRFEIAVREVQRSFHQRLEQQELFQIQNTVLKKLHEKVKGTEYCHSQDIAMLSSQYEDVYRQLQGSGRSYEDIMNEKSLVDIYSAFEKFLFDCFYTIYSFFPKYLGKEVKIGVSDLFVDGNIELCKRNIIEWKVKDFIQSKNIKEIMNGFKKDFKIDKLDISDDDIDLLSEISFIRNLIIHNHGIVNRVYEEHIKKLTPKYPFREGDTVFNTLPTLIGDLKEVSKKNCEKIVNAMIRDSTRLEQHHENKL